MAVPRNLPDLRRRVVRDDRREDVAVGHGLVQHVHEGCLELLERLACHRSGLVDHREEQTNIALVCRPLNIKLQKKINCVQGNRATGKWPAEQWRACSSPTGSRAPLLVTTGVRAQRHSGPSSSGLGECSSVPPAASRARTASTRLAIVLFFGTFATLKVPMLVRHSGQVDSCAR